MNRADVLRILQAHGALILDSHIVYTSGKHGSAYVNKDAIYPYTESVSTLCEAIAEHFRDSAIEVVAAPAIGGVILSQWVAHHLQSRQTDAIAVYAEKSADGRFEFRRGYDRLLTGRRVLVVEDILTTGGSLREVCRAVASAGGTIVGAAALCNRGGVTAAEVGGAPELFTLVEVSLDAWDEDACPLCAQGVPINTDVGKGREFLTRRVRETHQ
jgi:orotate phosphoribosyltransferase